MEKNISLLDFWVSKDFTLGDNPPRLSFGNQVINWGEDIFIIGGINAVNAFDLRKIHIPGVQVKEVFIPAPMISFTTGLGNGFSTEAYYQFRWNSFKFDPASTYWSSADFLGKGGKRGAFIPASYGGIGDFNPKIPGRDLASISAAGGLVAVERDEPELHSGQYGINLRFKPAEGDTEFAAYYIRYHDKIPFVGFRQNLALTCAPPCAPGTNLAGYTAIEQYGEDKDLFGISMNTKLGRLGHRCGTFVPPPRQCGYRSDCADMFGRPTSTQISRSQSTTLTDAGKMLLATGWLATVNGYVEEKKYQAHLTGFYLLPQIDHGPARRRRRLLPRRSGGNPLPGSRPFGCDPLSAQQLHDAGQDFVGLCRRVRPDLCQHLPVGLDDVADSRFLP
jgi:hypothetical protein